MAFPLAAALLLSLSGAGKAAAAWDTFIDGTVSSLVGSSPIAAEAGGRVWTASSGGATGFHPGDSSTIRLFRNDGLPDQDLTAVAIDQSGNRWFGSRSRGLQAQSTASGRFLSRALDQFDVGSDSVRVLLAVGSAVWVGTANGAARVTYPPDPDDPEDAVLATFNIEAFLGQSPLVNAIAARSDTTWFATQRGVVRREPDGSRSLVTNGLTDRDVRALAFFDGFLWAGTATNVFRLEDGAWVERSTGLVRGRPFPSFAIFEGTLHVGAITMASAASIYRLDPGNLSWSGRSTGVADRDARGLVVAAGTLWVSTNRGLYMLGANDTWQRIPAPDPPAPVGLSFNADYLDVAAIPGSSAVRAVTRPFMTDLGPQGWTGVGRGTRAIENRDFSRILIDRQGRTWLAHCCCDNVSTCGLDRLDGPSGNAIHYPAFNLIALAEAPDGRIWGGSVITDVLAGNGVYRIDPTTGMVENYTTASQPPLADNSVEALAFDGSGQLFIGYSSTGVDVWSNPGTGGTITHLDISQGLPNRNVRAIAFRGEEAWVGTTSGIGVFLGSLHVRTVPGNTLPDPLVQDLAVDGCGRVWASTPGGVAELDGEGRVLEVFDNDVIPSVAEERGNGISVDIETGTLWFATANGLSRFIYDRSCSGLGSASARVCTRLCPYPNPFEPARGDVLGLTDIGPTGPAQVAVLDAAGREVWSTRVISGEAVWDGRDAQGNPVPSGVYLLRIETEGGRGNLGAVFRPIGVRW